VGSRRVDAFEIGVPQSVLDDLEVRLRHARWPDQIPGSGWTYGIDTPYLANLTSYWAQAYSWRNRERELNALPQFRVELDGVGVHFVHARGKGRSPIPLLMLHGWPSSFVQFEKIIPLLTDPEAHGAAGARSFDVVVPSLPGFGFSDKPMQPGFATRAIAERMFELMSTLGYPRFGVRGSDVGGSVAQQMALARPADLTGLHVSGLLRGVPLLTPGRPPTPQEQKFLHDLQVWMRTRMAYASVQAQDPQTLAVGLNDSPAGLASWIIEKFQLWGDTRIDLERRFARDDLLTNVMIYWVTQTIGSSVRLYHEFGREKRLQGRVEVPTAVLMAQHDMVPVPRSVSERIYNVVRWSETPVGGHFLEWSEPELVARDLRAFFSLRA
jgi:pimeloyl-ACP methyl ester carboxylesterase